MLLVSSVSVRADQEAGHAADAAATRRSIELFEKHVRPTLIDACIRCHGPDKQKGGLRLDSAEWVRRGGDSGDVIDLVDPQQSLLLNAIGYDDPALEMPPKGKLPDETIDAFKAWIRSGAVDPREQTPSETAVQHAAPSLQQGREFWAFRPIQPVDPPEVKDSGWPRTEIDPFVLAKLESSKITPAADADRITLLRRAHYDLIGLPPTPQQIKTFVNDESDDAYVKMIDDLLNSPQFGERWGRHWLDVVRFAQSSGGGRTLLFPNAWRYRDYVIDAFNNDMPYDQFLTEQIAGDLLDSADWQDRRRQLIATAFLLLGPTNYEKQDKDELEMDVVDEQIDTIGKAMLGMTIGCARCHDHKFDPIPTEDYYALAGILKSTKAMIHDNVSKWNKVALPLAPSVEASIRQTEHEIATIEKTIKITKRQLEKIGGKPLGDDDKKRDKQIDSLSIRGIVIDDTEAERIGQWTPSKSAGRYVNEGYIHDGTAGKGSKQVIYRPQFDEPGVYEVRVGYSPSSNRSNRVPVSVHHADGTSTVRVDQRKTPEYDSAFTSVGVYRFQPGGDAQIVIANEGTDDGVVIADAVVLVPSKLAPLPMPDQVDKPENIPYIVQDASLLSGIVVDNKDAKLVGQWESSIHTPPFVGESYLHDKKESKGKKTATFTPDLPHDGIYEVRVAHNSNVRRASGVPILVRHAKGTSQVTINEDEPAPIDKLFRSIGEFYFEAGTTGHVTIQTTGTEGKYVIVDAVQFISAREKASNVREQQKALQQKIADLKKEADHLRQHGPQRDYAMATDDDEDAGDIPIAIRGVVHNPGPITPRGLMQVAAVDPRPPIPKGESGRRELAQWIASSENPLTARVFVNRVWHWLLGRGIVASVDNFGDMGDRPTHPELLDFLATSFMRNGWSTKQLIRTIMLSRTYRLSASQTESGLQHDPGNQLFWRINRKRLDAEQIRDTLLAIAGTLDEKTGGPNINPGTKSEYGYTFQSDRRSVYVPVFRNTLPEIFEVFDFADPNIQRGKRTTSTVASQALLLMNHPFVIERSRQAAERMLKSGSSSVTSKVEYAYLQLLGRYPTTEEIDICVEFLGDVADDAESVHRWGMLYQTLVQCVDFRYLN
mgnify:CR=1 FL=1